MQETSRLASKREIQPALRPANRGSEGLESNACKLAAETSRTTRKIPSPGATLAASQKCTPVPSGGRIFVTARCLRLRRVPQRLPQAVHRRLRTVHLLLNHLRAATVLRAQRRNIRQQFRITQYRRQRIANLIRRTARQPLQRR